MPYVATINTPGYLPWDDEPPVFETPREAWAYLADERARQEDDSDDEQDGYTDTYGELAVCGDETQETGGYLAGPDGLWSDMGLTVDGLGTIYGMTPGRDSYRSHDLGLAYSVTEVEEPVHDIVTSRLTGEAHCTVCGFGGCEKDEEGDL